VIAIGNAQFGSGAVPAATLTPAVVVSDPHGEISGAYGVNALLSGMHHQEEGLNKAFVRITQIMIGVSVSTFYSTEKVTLADTLGKEYEWLFRHDQQRSVQQIGRGFDQLRDFFRAQKNRSAKILPSRFGAAENVN